MGKGVGSSLTSRRVLRPGELVFVFSTNVLKSAQTFTSYIKARLAGNLVVSTWSKYFGTSFLGKSQQGFALIKETRPAVTGIEYRNTRRSFSKKISLYLRGRVRRRVKNKVVRRLKNVTSGLGSRLFSAELSKLGGTTTTPSRIKHDMIGRLLRRVLPSLRLQSRRVSSRSVQYCRFITTSAHLYKKPTRMSFPFRTPQSRVAFGELLDLFSVLVHARKAKNPECPGPRALVVPVLQSPSPALSALVN